MWPPGYYQSATSLIVTHEVIQALGYNMHGCIYKKWYITNNNKQYPL